MNRALEMLELDQDADERAIKRAYARLLRSNRPDDDPDAFQRLNEAYKSALSWAQFRSTLDQEAADEAPTPTRDCDDNLGLHVVAMADPADSAQSEHSAFEALPWRQEVAPPSVLPAKGNDEHPPEPPPTPTFSPELPVPPALPVQLGAPVPVDVEGLCETIIERTRTYSPSDLEHWLSALPELWLLRDKSQVGALLQWKLFEGEYALRESNFDVLARYFRWDEIGSGLDPMDAALYRHRMHRSWMLQPYGQGDLGRYLRSNGLPFTSEQVHRYMQYLRRPWRSMQSLCTAIPPWRTVGMNHLLEKLQIHDDQNVPPPLVPEQVAFWLAIKSSQMSAQRFMLALLRGASAGLALLAMAIMLWLVIQLFLPSSAAVSLSSALKVGLWGAGALVAASALLPIWQVLMRWISADENPSQPHPLLRLWLIPMLAIVSVAVTHLADQRFAGCVLAWLALWMATLRLWRRGRHTWKLNLDIRGWLCILFFVALPAMKILFLVLFFGELAAIGAVLLWLRDAWLRVRKTC